MLFVHNLQTKHIYGLCYYSGYKYIIISSVTQILGVIKTVYYFRITNVDGHWYVSTQIFLYELSNSGTFPVTIKNISKDMYLNLARKIIHLI